MQRKPVVSVRVPLDALSPVRLSAYERRCLSPRRPRRTEFRGCAASQKPMSFARGGLGSDPRCITRKIGLPQCCKPCAEVPDHGPMMIGVSSRKPSGSGAVPVRQLPGLGRPTARRVRGSASTRISPPPIAPSSCCDPLREAHSRQAPERSRPQLYRTRPGAVHAFRRPPQPFNLTSEPTRVICALTS